MQGTEYLRAINRIHHFFVERAPEIEPYLFWAPYDNIPRYDSRGVGGAETREVILIVDCVFFGIAVGLLVTLLNFTYIEVAILAGVIGFAAALVAHQRYEHFVLEREEKQKARLVQYPFPPHPNAVNVKQLTTNEQ